MIDGEGFFIQIILKLSLTEDSSEQTAALSKGILFLLTAMPAGTVIAMLAELFDADAIFASRAIAWTTLLALLTVPVMGMLL